MSLSGNFSPVNGLGGSGQWLGDLTESVGAETLNKIRHALNMAAAGVFARAIPIGGSKSRGLMAGAVIDAIDAVDFEIDNTSSYVSGSGSLTVPITVHVRVESASLSVTPSIYNVTTAANATVSGAAACTATNEDYSGTNQKQTLLLSLATGVNVYRLRFTPTSASYQFWGMGWRGLYVG